MEELTPLLEAIPTEAVETAMVTGIIGLALIVLGIGAIAVGLSRRDDGPGDSVGDGFEESLAGSQKAKSIKMIGGGVIALGALVLAFAVFSGTGPEGTVARQALTAQSAAEEGDLVAALEALEIACEAVECHEDEPNVIVKPEIQDAVASAHIFTMIARSTELAAAGDEKGAMALTERAYELDSSKETVEALSKVQVAQAKRFEASGKTLEAAKLYEEANAFADATRLYKTLGNHQDLCRLYPNVPDYPRAGEACLESENTALAGYYFQLAKMPMKAAAAYLESGRKQDGINIFLEAGMMVEAAQEYTEWAGEGGDRAADRYLAAVGLYEDMGDMEQALAHTRLAADAYATLADETQSKTHRIAAWQLYNDLEDSEAASNQMELAILKAAEFKSVGGLMELVRMKGEIGRGIELVRGWSEDALKRDEPHEAAQYLSLLLSNLMGSDLENEMSEEELAQMQGAMPGLLATNARIAEKVAQYPEIKVEAFAVSTTYEDSGLQIHNHTTLRGQVTNPHDYPIEDISLRVILFEPRFDTKELQIEGWRKIMAERGISEVEARKEWDKQTSEREKEMYDAPVGFKTDVSLGRIGPGETVTVDEKLDSDVSYTFIDYYFVGMKKGE